MEQAFFLLNHFTIPNGMPLSRSYNLFIAHMLYSLVTLTE